MWKLATVSVRGQNQVGLVLDTGLIDVEALARLDGAPAVDGPLSMLSLLERWDEWHGFLDALVTALANQNITGPALALPASSRLMAPILYPRKLICAGANYHAHYREMNPDAGPFDKSARNPYFFLKPPTTTVIGCDDTICIPPNSQKLDWEVELAAVIGRTAKNVPVEQAADYVAGYTVCNDISARDIHRREDWGPGPFYWDWLQSKGCDSFAPTGPYLVPRSQIGDPYNLRLTLSVNGEIQQDSNTSDLIFNVEEQVAYLSTMFTLEPGDVISTGTPPGVGAPRGKFLKRGDLVVAEIEGIGALHNPVG